MYSAFGKRVLDLFIVFVAFLVLSPLIFLVILLIRIFDSGPIFFTQDRVGKDANLFKLYKFRSMPVNTGDIPSDKVGEVKITWIGKLIRRTNIDELPQLLNIFKSDMSIVGPRPPIPAQTELISLRKDNSSISIKPGLTGLAQINSFDGMSFEEKASFDKEYYREITFWKDLKIISGTVLYLFKSPPVY